MLDVTAVMSILLNFFDLWKETSCSFHQVLVFWTELETNGVSFVANVLAKKIKFAKKYFGPGLPLYSHTYVLWKRIPAMVKKNQDVQHKDLLLQIKDVVITRYLLYML